MKNILILLLSICFISLTCELALRFWKKAWPFESAVHMPNHLTERDQPLRWRLSHSERRNHLGLRNREIVNKKSGINRILFLGDSLIWSSQTSSGRLYTEVLEQRLNAASADGTNSYEVINAGIPGYTTYQELEFLKIYGLDMEPDIVVLSFVFNDVYYKYLHRPTKDNFLAPEPLSSLHYFDTNTFLGNIFAGSYLAHQVVMRGNMLRKRVLRQPLFPFEERGDFYLAWKYYGWTAVQQLIGEMQQLLKEKGVPLSVLVFPVSDQVDDRYRSLNKEHVLYPQSRISNICSSYEIPMLDLTDIIYAGGGTVLYEDYLHLNAKGNDVVLDAIEMFLDNEILPVVTSAPY